MQVLDGEFIFSSSRGELGSSDIVSELAEIWFGSQPNLPHE
jgi:hypothetical protein